MRIIGLLVLGIILFFFLGEAVKQLFKKPLPGITGIIVIFIGIFMGLFDYFLSDPLNILLSVFLMGSGIGLAAHHFLAERYLISEKKEMAFIIKHKIIFERSLEILPGALTWIALTSPLWLSLTLPFAVAYLILIADIYWLLNSLKMAVLIILGYRKVDWAKKQPWLEMLNKDFPKEWENYYHFVEIHTYKEPLEVLKPAFDAVINSEYPAKKVFLGIGLEERDSAEKIEEVKKYAKENGDKIGGIFVTIHPFGLPGEVPGAASNRNFVVRNAAKEFEKRGISQDKVFVTTLDADFVIHKQFLAGALYKYLSLPADTRDKRSFTGAFFYYNNYWQAPTPMRLIATGTAFWQMAEMVGSDKYINYSSMSINLKSLMDIGLWIPDKVNDDSGFFWKAYFHYKGDYKVIPHFMPISADAVLDVNLVKTFQNQYLQLKRWAYGVEHMPFIFKEYFKSTDIDFWDKTDKLFFVLWANLKWGTLALFVTFAGIVIPYINPYYSQSAVAINLPIISSWILTAAFIGLFSTVFVHEKTVPKRPKKWSILNKFWSYIQWILLPVTLVTISTIPAIDAQTSLMLGKHLEFRVTNKARAITS